MAGLAITGYKYALSTSADNVTYSSYGSYITSSWTSGTTFTITGLTNGTYYKVKIRAVNALGDGAESAEIGAFRPNTVPGTPAAAILTAGDATDTFTWTAPASNGSTITKYGYQVSTDNGSNWYSAIGGTLNGETETANLSVALATQYSTNSYKLRVRAFNNGTNGGWSSYSTISSSGTAVWVYGTREVTETDSTCTDGSCSSSSAASRSCGTCGTESGTTTGTRTRSRTRVRTDYRYTRLGSTSQEWTFLSRTEYPATYTYTDWSYSTAWSGSCSESGCGGSGWVHSSQTYSYGNPVQVGSDWYDGAYYDPDWNGHPSGWLSNKRVNSQSGPLEGCSEGTYAYNLYNLYRCTATGNFCVTLAGCWDPPST